MTKLQRRLSAGALAGESACPTSLNVEADYVGSYAAGNQVHTHVATACEAFGDRDVDLVEAWIGRYQSSIKDRHALAGDEALDGRRSSDARTVELHIQRVGCGAQTQRRGETTAHRGRVAGKRVWYTLCKDDVTRKASAAATPAPSWLML